jgi:hypothetical protein
MARGPCEGRCQAARAGTPRQRVTRMPAVRGRAAVRGQDRAHRQARAGTVRARAARMRAVHGQVTRISGVHGRPAVRRPAAWKPVVPGLAVRACGHRGRTGRARKIPRCTGRMPAVRLPAGWRPGLLEQAVRACGIRGRTGRARKVRQRTSPLPAVLGGTIRRRGTGRARKVQRRAALLRKVPGPTAWMPGSQGRSARTAGVLGRRTVRVRSPRRRPAQWAGVLGRTGRARGIRG